MSVVIIYEISLLLLNFQVKLHGSFEWFDLATFLGHTHSPLHKMVASDSTYSCND